MTRDELETLREGFEFEAKTAGGPDGRGQLPGSFWETYSAMANTEGGYVLLGARERRNGTLELVGVPQAAKVVADLWNTIDNRGKVSANLLQRSDVLLLDQDGPTLILVQVPRAPRSVRPVYLNRDFERGTFVRLHDGDHRVTADVARRMIADGQTDGDAHVQRNYGEADLDAATLRRYREIFAARRAEHAFLAYEGRDFLEAIGAWGTERETGVEGPTLGGLLMFGTERALMDRFPHWHLSYREEDPEVPRRWVDRVDPDGTWVPNVFMFYLRAVPKLHAGVKAPFSLGADGFRRDESPVHDALREALINTLIHADYAGPSGIRVIRRPSGFEFVNPGMLLLSPSQVWKGGVSECRNPRLQRLFKLVNLAEREGSGGPAIRRAWEAQHWRSPSLRSDPETMQTTLELGQVSLLPEASVVALEHSFGSAFRKLNEVRRLALATAHAEGGITHARLRELSGEHPRELTLALTDLKSKGMLVSAGTGRGTTYQVTIPNPDVELQRSLFGEEPGSTQSMGQSSTPSMGQSTSHEPGRSSTHSADSSTHSVGSITHSDGSTTHSDGNSTPSMGQSAPSMGQSASSMGQSLARIADTPWARADEVRIAIMEFCSEYRTIPEIARAIGRSEATVRANYVRELVAEGRLQRLYPDQPRHPSQAYVQADPPNETDA